MVDYLSNAIKSELKYRRPTEKYISSFSYKVQISL
jgi:hypothetical protein